MNKYQPSTRSIFMMLLILGAIPATLVITLYIWHFAPLSNYELSNEVSAWSGFGSYFGGLLSVWFAFLAFGGVLLTVRLQTKQLQQAKSQAHLEELQRVISGIASNIDDVLNSVPAIIPAHRNFSNGKTTVFTVISAGGTAALGKTDNHISEASRQQLLAILKESISLQTGILGIEFDQLVWCLKYYEEASGSPIVIHFYRRRYQAIVCWLDAMGYFSDLMRLQEYFEPSNVREFLASTYK